MCIRDRLHGLNSVLVPEAYDQFLVVGENGILQSLDPVGIVSEYAGVTPPVGWLAADGSEYNPALYPDLFLVIACNYGTGATPGFCLLPSKPAGTIIKT